MGNDRREAVCLEALHATKLPKRKLHLHILLTVQQSVAAIKQKRIFQL